VPYFTAKKPTNTIEPPSPYSNMANTDRRESKTRIRFGSGMSSREDRKLARRGKEEISIKSASSLRSGKGGVGRWPSLGGSLGREAENKTRQGCDEFGCGSGNFSTPGVLTKKKNLGGDNKLGQVR